MKELYCTRCNRMFTSWASYWGHEPNKEPLIGRGHRKDADTWTWYADDGMTDCGCWVSRVTVEVRCRK